MTAITGPRARRGIEASRRRAHRIGIIVLIPFVVFAVFPLLWMAVSSIKSQADLYRFPVSWIPKSIDWSFYERVLGGTPFAQFALSSTIVAVSSTALVVAFSAMAGYGLARGRFRGRAFISRGVLIAYIFPTILFVVPLFTLISGVGLAGSYVGVIIVHVAFNFPFCTSLMAQYFESVPIEIEEAGRMDGLSTFGVFRKVALPLAGPGLATTAVFGFINSWNEFLLSFVILGGGDKRTLPVGIYNFVGSEVADWGPLMAATTLTVLPPLILFIVAQRRITGGLTAGAVKG